jgi:proprotein convertase subtilisin/kexin type 5
LGDGTNNCSCDDGYFYDGGLNTCRPCNVGCKTCTNSSNCSACFDTATPSGSIAGSCECASTKFFKTATRTCADCG